MLRFSPVIYFAEISFKATLCPKLEFEKVLEELSKDGQDKAPHPFKFDRSISKQKAIGLVVSFENLDKE